MKEGYLKEKCRWSVIPDLDDLKRFSDLAEEFDLSFEYNDFYLPSIYDDQDEIKRRIEIYKTAGRDRSDDTLHGVFYDISITSDDPVIRKRSRDLAHLSMDVAQRLGCRGVVFHTGLISGLNFEKYISGWVSSMSEYLHELAGEFPDIGIYMENTFEQTPDPLTDLMKETKDLKNVGICFDYAHAVLTGTEPSEWFKKISPYIRHMHINDNDLKADLHLAVGEGSMDFGEFERLMACYEPETRILLEIKGYEGAKTSLINIGKM